MQIYRWGVVVGVDCVLELGLIAIPAWLFAPVRMDRYKKTMVVVLFGFRFLYDTMMRNLRSNSELSTDQLQRRASFHRLHCLLFALPA